MRIFSIILLLIICIVLVVLCFSCTKIEANENYNDKCDKILSSMKSPVIIIGINETWAGFSVSLKDSSGQIVSFGNMSMLANTLGKSHQIGDTIK